MSGFIAVSVSLIGLSGVLFTLAIFVQMILSFPAMLSSNSQAYVQQQRKTYNISAGLGLEEMEVDLAAELECEHGDEHVYQPEQEQGQDQDQEDVEDSVEKWVDIVDEAMNGSSLKTEATQQPQGRKFINSSVRAEAITRGRPLKRRRRTGTARPELRSKTTGRYDPNDPSDYDFETEQVHKTEDEPTHERQHCNPAWRNSMAC